MNRIIILIISLIISYNIQAQYQPDILGSNYEQRKISMPDDYEGNVICTLVRHVQQQSTKKAVLYLHGYNDYFFQSQLGDSICQRGYHFYALDLRKYGRSLLPHQDAFYCSSLNEYFADIDTAISIIRKEGIQDIILMGHSTGGLISSYYLKYHPNSLVKGLVLNSPFLDWNFNGFMETIVFPTISFIGRFFPQLVVSTEGAASYAHSLLKNFKGEWEFNTDWKMPNGHLKRAGWIRAIHKAQQDLQDECHINCPILLLSANRSFTETNEWHDEYLTADIVLSVDDIQKYGSKLGPNVTAKKIENGIHDLILSPLEARNKTYQIILSWLDSIR